MNAETQVEYRPLIEIISRAWTWYDSHWQEPAKPFHDNENRDPRSTYRQEIEEIYLATGTAISSSEEEERYPVGHLTRTWVEAQAGTWFVTL